MVIGAKALSRFARRDRFTRERRIVMVGGNIFFESYFKVFDKFSIFLNF